LIDITPFFSGPTETAFGFTCSLLHLASHTPFFFPFFFKKKGSLQWNCILAFFIMLLIENQKLLVKKDKRKPETQ